jgi:hypothetical protein
LVCGFTYQREIRLVVPSGACHPTSSGCGTSSDYQWRADMFRPDLVHLANLTGRLSVAGGRRWVFAVDKRTADIDKPEVPGRTSRCPDCELWAQRQGHSS